MSSRSNPSYEELESEESAAGQGKAEESETRRMERLTLSSSSDSSDSDQNEIQARSGSEEEREHEDEVGTQRSEASQVADTFQKSMQIGIGKRMDPIDKMEKEEGIVMSQGSLNALDRALEYMQLYLSRYINEHFNTDWVRRMLFYARINGAPLRRIKIPDLPMDLLKEKSKMQNIFASISAGFLSSNWTRAIDMEQFFERMDYLEEKYGERLWELHFIYGYEHFDPQIKSEQIYFRWQVISTIRTLYKACEQSQWALVAQHISDISIALPLQHNALSYFTYIRNSLAPYMPAIFLCALQCLLESKQSIEEISQHFMKTFLAFKGSSLSAKNPVSQNYYWMDNLLFFFSNLVTLHLVNLHIQTAEGNNINIPSRANIRDAGFDENSEHRRIASLLEYCLDVEKYLFNESIDQINGGEKIKGQFHHQKRSLANFFTNFLNLLFEQPKNSLGLFPLIVWGAIQFDCEEELTDSLIDACTKYPYLLIHVYNTLARFHMEHIAGQLFETLFGLAIELLSTSPVILEILEQRSLDPTSFGTFDNVISQNLRALFSFLDLGRHRSDIRAWALFHSNLYYLYDNKDLLRAIVLPLWEKRKDWWPHFHNIRLSSIEAEHRREQAFDLLIKLR